MAPQKHLISYVSRSSSKLNRFVSSALLIVFVTSTMIASPFSYASAENRQTVKIMPDFVTELRLPESLGGIKEFHQGSSKQTVILVQDAHAIPDAQRSIQEIIRHFQNRYGIELVAFEGSASEIDAQIFKSFPDKDALKRTFAGYAENGELTGVTAAAIFNESPSRYQGIENWDLYGEGLGFYLKASEQQPKILEKIQALKNRLREEKAKVYSKELLAIDGLLQNFHSNQNTLAPVLKQLAQIKAPEKNSALALMLEEINRSSVSPVSAEAEVRKIAEQVRTVLKDKAGSHSEWTAFNKNYQEFQTSRISAEAFALFLQAAAQKENLHLEISADLAHAMQNQKKMRDIEGTAFFKEFESYAQAVKESLFTGKGEQQLDQETRRLEILGRFASLEASCEDWQEMQSLRIEPELRGMMESHFSFYKNAQKRDAVFHENLLSLMQKNGVKTSLLVAGGFHTEGLVQQLRQDGISYVLITPQISSLPESNAYSQQMKGGVSWENYFREENGRVNLYDAFVRAVRDRLLEAPKPENTSYKTQILKEWRDQILRDLADQKKITQAGDYVPFVDEVLSEEPKPLWQLKVEKFLENLKQLDRSGRLAEQQIVKLFNPSVTSTMQPYAPANAGVPGAAVPKKWIYALSGRPEIRKSLETVQLQVSELEPRSTPAIAADYAQPVYLSGSAAAENERIALSQNATSPEDQIVRVNQLELSRYEDRRGNGYLKVTDTVSKEITYLSLPNFGWGGVKAVSPDKQTVIIASDTNSVYVVSLKDYKEGRVQLTGTPANEFYVFKQAPAVHLPALKIETLFQNVLQNARFIGDNTVDLKQPDGDVYRLNLRTRNLEFAYQQDPEVRVGDLELSNFQLRGNNYLQVRDTVSKEITYLSLPNFGWGGIKAVSPDKNTVIIASESDAAYVVDLGNYKDGRVHFDGTPAKDFYVLKPAPVVILPSGENDLFENVLQNARFTGNNTAQLRQPDNEVYNYNLRTGELEFAYTQGRSVRTGNLVLSNFQLNGTNYLQVRDTDSGEVTNLSLPNFGFGGIKAVSPDKKTVIIASETNAVYVVDLENYKSGRVHLEGTPAKDFYVYKNAPAVQLPSGDEDLFSNILQNARFTGNNTVQLRQIDGEVYDYNTRTGQLQFAYIQDRSVRSGDLVLSRFQLNGNNYLQVRDTVTQEMTYLSLPNFGWGGIKAVSPDKKTVLIASESNAVYIVDLENYKNGREHIEGTPENAFYVLKPAAVIQLPAGNNVLDNVLQNARFVGDNTAQLRQPDGEVYDYNTRTGQLQFAYTHDGTLRAGRFELSRFQLNSNNYLQVRDTVSKENTYLTLPNFGWGGIKDVRPDGAVIIASESNVEYLVDLKNYRNGRVHFNGTPENDFYVLEPARVVPFTYFLPFEILTIDVRAEIRGEVYAETLKQAAKDTVLWFQDMPGRLSPAEIARQIAADPQRFVLYVEKEVTEVRLTAAQRQQLNALRYFAAAKNPEREVIHILISPEDIQEWGDKFPEMLSKLMTEAYADAGQNKNAVTLITVPKSEADRLHVKEHNLNYAARIEISENTAKIYHAGVNADEMIRNSKPVIVRRSSAQETLAPGTRILLLDQLGDGTHMPAESNILAMLHLAASIKDPMIAAELLKTVSDTYDVVALKDSNSLTALGLAVARMTEAMRSEIRIQQAA